MKKIVLFLVLCLALSLQAQQFPSAADVGFGFTIGSKVTIQLEPVGEGRFNYKIIDFEPFDSVINPYDYASLFPKKGAPMTIQFVYCIATSGSNAIEQMQNTESVLLMRSYLPQELQYNLMIQRNEESAMESPEQRFLPPGRATITRWPFMVLNIGVTHFELKK